MSRQAAAEPYTTRFETGISAVDGRDVTLETTYFYPQSGGQPADRGKIDGKEVVDVQVTDDGVVHRLAEAPGWRPGHRALCEVDWSFRMYCMRAHTASHALYGAGRRVLDDLGYGGFGIDDKKIRIDFRTTTDVTDETLVELERLVNEAVWDSRDVSWEEVPVEDARERDDVAFNTKTEEGVFGDSDTVRVVTIEGWDAAACGGTHVRNTREIGPVTVIGRSNPGEGLTRVEFAVGTAGIDRRTTEKSAAFEASTVLGANVTEVPQAARRLQDEVAELEAEVEELRENLLDRRVADLCEDVEERGGRTVVAGTVDGVGPNDVDDVVRELAGDVADVVALVGSDRPPFVVVGSETDATDVIDDVTAEFGGGGGGSDRVAQAGGLDGDPDRIVEYLKTGDSP
ncbi:alanyl-tRNA editing protein [Halostella pelagica]|uniref:alanyl-tRNA editing protein n=1 Tax=Halostella pelagica TaxID=2583824 RepID=UPI0010816F89|nr:DHHA1 domain-containing protein [Halostella pelagica]